MTGRPGNKISVGHIIAIIFILLVIGLAGPAFRTRMRSRESAGSLWSYSGS
ncbi:MAG: hypothetical protein LUP97_01045 [Methanoregula sp.]|nr:hypothetical protein [Methanoregula sp.]